MLVRLLSGKLERQLEENKMAYNKQTPRQIRKCRIKKKISGTAERPRLTIFKSNQYIYAQIIDDDSQKTLVACSTLKQSKGVNKANASSVGKGIAEQALEKQIKQVVFDRNGYKFHGVVKELAESARKAGLQF